MNQVKIDTELVQGQITELYPSIFVFEIKDDYERAMLFCRHQEFYESSYEDIKGKSFSLEYFMNRYRKDRGANTFTYANDWIGFNIPSDSLINSFRTFGKTNNINDYDEILETYLDKALCGRIKDYYIIGVKSVKELSVLNHELSHAFFHTDKNYKENCEQLIETIDIELRNNIYDELKRMGYSSDLTILKDELQAYMSTGLNSNLKPIVGENNIVLIEQFENNFKSFVKEKQN